MGFIPLVESYQKTLKNGIHSFPARRSAFMRGCGELAGKFACCVLGARHITGRPIFMWKTGDPEMATPKRVRTHRPKHSDISLSRECRIIWQIQNAQGVIQNTVDEAGECTATPN